MHELSLCQVLHSRIVHNNNRHESVAGLQQEATHIAVRNFSLRFIIKIVDYRKCWRIRYHSKVPTFANIFAQTCVRLCTSCRCSFSQTFLRPTNFAVRARTRLKQPGRNPPLANDGSSSKQQADALWWEFSCALSGLVRLRSQTTQVSVPDALPPKRTVSKICTQVRHNNP